MIFFLFDRIERLKLFVRLIIFKYHNQKIDVWPIYPKMDFKTVVAFVLRDFVVKIAGGSK